MSEPPANVGPFGESALQALIEQAPDGIFVADSEGRYIYVNEAGCRMVGYSQGELLGMKIEDTVLTSDSGRLDRAKAVTAARPDPKPPNGRFGARTAAGCRSR